MFLAVFLLVLFLKEIISFYLDIRNLKYALSHKEVPEIFKDIITDEDFKKSQIYLKDRVIFNLWSKTFDFIFNLIFIFLLYPYIEKVASSITSSFILQGLLFFGIFGLINLIISIPFDLYYIFVIENKYGFNTMTPKIFLLDLIKSIILSIILGTPILSLLLYIIKSDPNFWWKFALVIIIFEIIMVYIYPILIAPIFNKFTPLENEDLRKKIIELLERVGFNVKQVFVMDASKRTRKQNAYFTGIGKSKRVVLYDTLLSYPQEEIVAIFAHELGHYKKRHITILMLSSIIFYVFYIYLTFIVFKSAPLSKYFGVQKEFTLLTYAFIFASSFFYFLNPLINFLSRKMEYSADRFSAELIGTPYPLISALIRLVKENLSNLYPDPLYRTWYYSHPTPSERIYHLLTLEKEVKKDENNNSPN